MPDNPQRDPGTFLALPDHRVLTLTGRDAAAFSQAQFMNDVAGLSPGQWQWSGWLTPKGRVVALFALVLVDAETVCLVVPDADPVALAAQLQRYVFRSRVALRARDDLFVGGAFQASQAQGNRWAGDGLTDMELDVGGEGIQRALRIGTAPFSTSPGHGTAWKMADLDHGLPRLADSQSAQWTPQQLSLDRLRAFSVRKGCYPGQEIVARTHFLGEAKRGIALFDADGDVQEGDAVTDGGQPLGQVVSVATHPGGTRLLAVLPLARRDSSLHVRDAVLHERTLAGGLAR
jgi:folate-binding protein YgfZ